MDTLIPTADNEVEENDGLPDAFIYEEMPDYTYKMNIDSERIAGYVAALEAYKQAVYKILNTERYEHIIYSWDYGIELKDLFGQPIPYVVPELERRIIEAVMQDERTENVGNFDFDTSKKGVVAVKFTAESVLGSVEIEKEIAI